MNVLREKLNLVIPDNNSLIAKARELAVQDEFAAAVQEEKIAASNNDKQAADEAALDHDTLIARKTIQGLLEKSEDVFDELIALAKSGEHPRSYEVAAGMMNTISSVAKDLVEVHQRQRKARKESMVAPVPAAPTTNIENQQIVFTGTTSDLLKQIKSGPVIDAS